MNNILKSCIVLFIVSSVCVTALAYVNEITKEPIKKQIEIAEIQAYNKIFPNADDFKKNEKTVSTEGAVQEITSAYNSGALIGYVVKLDQKGYGGSISLMVGIENNGSVSGIEVLSHSETPGLGASIKESWFQDRYAGKNKFPLHVTKSASPAENEIDAITSATISTRAVTDAVNAAYEWFETEGGGR